MRSPATEDLRTHFDRFGFVHLPGVLGPSEVDHLRALLKKQFAHPADRALMPRHCFQIPEVYTIPLKERIVEALDEILGKGWWFIPDLEVHRNILPQTSWHEDCGNEGPQPYLMDPDYRFVKCGLYLQDNTREWGGGVCVIPGGHKFPVRTPFLFLDFKIKNLLQRKLGRLWRERLVPLKAGDFLAFDSRLPHCSTWAQALKEPEYGPGDIVLNMPEDKTKLVVYWNVCRRGEDALHYLHNAEKRVYADELERPENREWFFLDFLRYRFPEDYPPSFAKSIEEHGIHLACLPEERTAFWKRIWAERNLT